MKRLDYQNTFNGILTNIDEMDFNVAPESELLFTIADTIPVYKNNNLMARSKGIIAYISLKTESMRPFIMVDSLFESLSLNAQVFTIYHELGHYQNGDFLDKKISLSDKAKIIFNTFILKKYPEKEVLADYYAIDKMDSIENGLSALQEIHGKINEIIKDKKKLKKMNKRFNSRMIAINKMIENGPYFINEESIPYTSIFSEEEYDKEKEDSEIEEHFVVEDPVESTMAALTEFYGAELTKVISNELNKQLEK